MEHILDAMDIPTDKAECLAAAGATAPKKLLRFPKRALEQLLNDDEINHADCADLVMFKDWLIDMQDAGEVIPGNTDLDTWRTTLSLQRMYLMTSFEHTGPGTKMIMRWQRAILSTRMRQRVILSTRMRRLVMLPIKKMKWLMMLLLL